MRLYIVKNELKFKRYVVARNANDARRYAIDSGIAGHKIDRHVWKSADGQILEVDRKPGVIDEETFIEILNAAGYNLDGSEYRKPEPVKRRGRKLKVTADGRRACLRCGELKPLTDFAPKSGGGYMSYCRPCKILYDRENRAKKKAI